MARNRAFGPRSRGRSALRNDAGAGAGLRL